MADSNSNSTDAFNVLTQVFTILGPDGTTQIPISVDMVDWLYHLAITTEINYGSQIGASFMMLVVCLIMTPRSKFARIPTMINIAALAVNVVRCVLLAWFPSSKFYEFYIVMTGDTSTVPYSNFVTSAVATFCTFPILILMESALAIQAWAMIKSWPRALRCGAVGISGVVVVSAIGFKIADSVYQALWILYRIPALVLIRKIDLAFSTSSICWFCFLFNVRLAMHMWKHRSILPSVKGLSAMDVLVMTNGVLMLVPTIFATLEYGTFTNFEFGSLTYTAVVIVLPLGTLAAQRIASPSSFNSPSRTHAPSSGHEPVMKSWHSSSEGSHGVSSHIVSDGRIDSRERQSSLQDGGYAKYGCGDLEKGVRVEHLIEHNEETVY